MNDIHASSLNAHNGLLTMGNVFLTNERVLGAEPSGQTNFLGEPDR